MASARTANIIEAAECRALTGCDLKESFRRVLEGGRRRHPLGFADRFRWDAQTDSYTITHDEGTPPARLFRRGGRWVVAFDSVAPLRGGFVPLFEDPGLDEPVYTLLALLYCGMVVKYPALRQKKMAEISKHIEEMRA